MFSQRFFAASPEPGHLTSRISLARSSTGVTSIDPEVSISTSYPPSHRRLINSNDSLCASGSPPVTSTSLQPYDATRAITSSIDIFSPPVKVYSESHHRQRRLHPAKRTKTQ